MPLLVVLNDNGLFCEAGNFYIDPWQPVARALITHAHSDHARFGAEHYLAAEGSLAILRARLGDDSRIETLRYGEAVTINGVRVSFHSAGHVLGSAQIRLEAGGEVCVVSGDYKLAFDPTCDPFEPVKCHRFITESTFGLPIYRWEEPATLMSEINAWWQSNASVGRASLLYAYALGKAQRILSGIDTSIGPVYAHGAVTRMNDAYRAAGVCLPDTRDVAGAAKGFGRALVLAPPLAMNTPWTRRFGDASRAFASGWMTMRGMKRRRSIDRGFALSDHADWPGLLQAIEATGAEEVWVTHGYANEISRYLCERGVNAQEVATRFTGEQLEELNDA
jgi:putative mRNA 3-end processing factor